MGSHLPLVIVEGVMVFGGALLFGWWQLRSVRRDREKSAQEARRKAAEEAACAEGVKPATAPPHPVAPADRTQPGSPSDPPA